MSGPGTAFGVRRWISPTPKGEPGRWQPFGMIGDRANLRAGVLYKLKAHVVGSTVALYVNGVHALSCNTDQITRPRQVGIWCASFKNIRISNFQLDAEKPHTFAVMQFTSPYNEVYSEVIKEACKEYRVDAIRADEIYGPGIIIRDVTDKIARSRIIIADITPPNPNVYFEVGYALALNKPIILLARKDTPLPFDVSPFRVLFYEDSIAGKAKVQEGLRRHLKEIVGVI